MTTQQEIESKYRELVKTLTDAYSQLEDIEGDNPELKDLQGDLLEKLKALILSTKNESEHSLKAIAWDRLVIAFFGETNAGKSTIIETFRIMFEKGRKKGQDGLIVGDGRQDFTKDYHEYNMSIDGRPFTLIDVPGIEGDESEFKDIIKDALGKAHCVFYVQGHNKKPDSATAEKIKQYLGDWVNVYSIQNIRGSVSDYDEAEERESLLTAKVLKNESLTKEAFQAILGDVYKGNIPLQALLAMCSKASFSDKRPDLQKSQKKLLSYFGSADEVLRFSQFQAIVNLVKEKSNNFTEEIAESNKQKLISLARQANNEMEKVWSENEEDIEALRSHLRNFRRDANAIISSCQIEIRSSVRNSVNSQFNSLKQSLYSIIDNNSDDKDLAQNRVEEFRYRLRQKVQSILGDEVKNMQTKLTLKQKDLKGISSITVPNFTIPSNIDFDIDVNDALEEMDVNLDDLGDFALGTAGMAGTGAAIGSVVPVVGTITGAIVGGVIGFLGTSIKKATGDGGRGSAKNEVSKRIDSARSKVMNKIGQELDMNVYNLEKAKRAINSEIEDEIKNLDKMESMTDRVKERLSIYIGILKTAEYGTI